jgi:predicted RNase H-like nuclease (RuvC/YqgF family)
MDNKYLAKIKELCTAGRPVRRIDVKALIAEVERLTKENQGLRTNSMIQESIISKGRNPADKEKIVHITMDNAEKDREIATLKKEIEQLAEERDAAKRKKDELEAFYEQLCRNIAQEASK